MEDVTEEDRDQRTLLARLDDFTPAQLAAGVVMLDKHLAARPSPAGEALRTIVVCTLAVRLGDDGSRMHDFGSLCGDTLVGLVPLGPT